MKPFGIEFFLPCVGPLVLLGTWQLVASLNLSNFYFLPLPYATLARAIELLTSYSFGLDLLATFGRWSAGFLLAVLVGAPIGILLGASRTLYTSTSFLIDFFRSLPVTAAFPIFLVALGVGNAAMVAMVFFATVFILIMHTSYGIRATPDVRSAMAKSFGATPLQIFVHIRLIEAAGNLLVGMRTVLSLSLIVAIVSEMFIGTARGVGQRLYLAYQLQSLEELYAIVLIVGLMGYCANELFTSFERRIEV